MKLSPSKDGSYNYPVVATLFYITLVKGQRSIISKVE